ncbi:FAD/NAD(P)-binding oxidoreductase [Trinickia dabaoshanensis]|uniref:FAD/NAD(P)-binding oxidoreductase n=1 Tax=Trinickia dabaoshanensis TaxID=564714 RepID=A0A2N7VL37_9BURK|nr:NAD(P)/FAD-dependent oxidoreductase [Trinickia dabaoshanensis]PMS17853.1 FAD/NAD(P)-binding oxidoreductase [Trinickia dabaoshanensis]
MTNEAKVVIVGAGPAGIRAAEALVAEGVHPIVLDENARWGGQIYRQPPDGAGFRREPRELYGFEARKATALHAAMASLLPHLDYRPHTLAWACEVYAHAEQRPGRSSALVGHLATLRATREQNVPFTHLIVASGATDRILPMPGWTLPGVYTLGAAQTALKAQGCAIGRRVVFAGTGPLLYLVAYQYAKAGARVLAVLDTSPIEAQAAALPKLMAQPSILAKGLYYVGWLRAHGVRIERGVSLEGVLGEGQTTGIAWRSGASPRATNDDRLHTLECDAVGYGFGLRPETQLADIAGCRFYYDAINRCWLPERDEAGRTSVRGIYVAGDGAAIAGADAAQRTGRLAALAVLDDMDREATRERRMPRVDAAGSVRRAQQRTATFRAGLESAFRTPVECAGAWPDAMTVCRCEEIDAGSIRQCIRSGAAQEINRLKALTRVGMGRCQGRMCGDAAAALLAHETRLPPEALGRLRAQAPIKPIPLAAALCDERVAAVPEDARDE